MILVIIVIGILFVTFISRADNINDKAKITGVQSDFRAFYTAVKKVGLENQLYTIPSDKFEDLLNDNLDKQLQFTDGVCVEKDPWGEPYTYATSVDITKQTRYIVFASKGGRDVVELKLEDVVDADSDEMNVYMALKQVETQFQGGITTGVGAESQAEAAVYDALREDAYNKWVSASGSAGSGSDPAIILTAGLYQTGTDTMIKSWQELLADGTIHVTDGVLTSNYNSSSCTNSSYDALAGDLVIDNSVTSIGEYALIYCSKITSINIPDSITTIGKNAFYNCSGLISIDLPDSITSIGASAFLGCKSLLNITIPNGVQIISSGMFQQCTSLTSVTIGNGVTTIVGGVFYGCTNLTDVTIGNGVTAIDAAAFINCTNLTSVKFKNTSGWYVGNSVGEKTIAIGSPDLSDTSTAATYLKSTYLYKSWTRE